MFNMTGVFIVFKIEQFQIRREIKRQIKGGIPEEELHFFSISHKQYEALDWERKDIEFRLGDLMFDIVRYQVEGDEIHLYCVNDKEEKILFAKLDEMVKRKMDHDSKSPNSSANLFVKFFKIFHFVQDLPSTLETCLAASKSAFAEKNIIYLSPYLSKETAPPDAV